MAAGHVYGRALQRVFVGLAVGLAGCAAVPRFDGHALPSTELVDVPFFPQDRYQCGPAALATILAYEGLPVDAQSLAPDVYVEGLKGSLQAELLGATRRHGLIPYVLEPAPTSLFAEVDGGKPVLVLQNLGLKRLPAWHYAVVVGYDAERGRVLLRSGKQRRRAEPLARFLRRWELADRWAFVSLRPDELPVTATAERYIRALAAAEPLLGDAADVAYDGAERRWPDDPLVLFAAAGHELGAARYAPAAALYEQVLDREPRHAAARNNLANARAAQGCRSEALRQARAALADVALTSPLRPAIEDTVAQLQRASAAGPEPPICTH